MKAIAAVTKNNIIGVNDKLPYHIPDDLKWFKEHTKNNVIIMGYNTWVSLGEKPLPNRVNIVITNQQKKASFDKLVFFMTFEHYIKYFLNHLDWVVGGSQIYQIFEPFINTWYLTVTPHYNIEPTDKIVYFKSCLRRFKMAAYIPRETHEFQIWSRVQPHSSETYYDL